MYHDSLVVEHPELYIKSCFSVCAAVPYKSLTSRTPRIGELCISRNLVRT
jgi:hypothetical protein